MSIKTSWTPVAVRQAYNRNPDAGHFFDRDTMRFFGDKMSSFGCTCLDGVDYLYRKRTATVNVFGTLKAAGREHFNCWRIVESGGRVDLDGVGAEMTETLYRWIY